MTPIIASSLIEFRTRFYYRSSVVTALSLIDYGNATLAGLPTRQLCRLQSVLHAAARIIFSARKFDHVTPLLRELHWFRVPERITFKLASLVFRCLNGTGAQHHRTWPTAQIVQMSKRSEICVCVLTR